MINFWHLWRIKLIQMLEQSLFISTSTRTKWGENVRLLDALTVCGEKKENHWILIQPPHNCWHSQSPPVPRKGLTSPNGCSLLDWRVEHCATYTLQSATGQHTPRGCSPQWLVYLTSVYRAEAEPHVEISFNHWTILQNLFFLLFLHINVKFLNRVWIDFQWRGYNADETHSKATLKREETQQSFLLQISSGYLKNSIVWKLDLMICLVFVT